MPAFCQPRARGVLRLRRPPARIVGGVGRRDGDVTGKPAPAPDAFSEPYWRGAAEGRLVLPRCEQGHLSYPPGPACPQCGSRALTATEVPGAGTLYSFTVVRQSADPAFAADLPYVVALVELDAQPGLRLLTNVVDSDLDALAIGAPVEAVYEARGDQAVPQFRLVGVGGAA
jgi:uncharacterized OB-fold protein